MITKPIDVLQRFPIRKSKAQKAAFRDEVTQYVQAQGYAVNVEKGSFGAQNIVIGNPETAKFLVTAHYDTPAALPFPNLITPCNFWPFLGYQLVITVLIFLIAFIPGLILALAGVDAESASIIWLLSLYAILALMLFGPANKQNANDNTSGVVTVLEIAKTGCSARP